MSESKELLEATIKGLEEKLQSVTSDLNMKNRELEDVSKPEMTSEMFDNITELMEDAVSNVYLDSDSLEYSMEFDYDNKVCLNFLLYFFLSTNTEEPGGLTPCSSSTRRLTPRLCLLVSFIYFYYFRNEITIFS